MLEHINPDGMGYLSRNIQKNVFSDGSRVSEIQAMNSTWDGCFSELSASEPNTEASVFLTITAQSYRYME